MACGLELCNREGGGFPDSLDGLDSIPKEFLTDPFIGSAFDYTLGKNGYTLRSTGPDKDLEPFHLVFDSKNGWGSDGDIVIRREGNKGGFRKE